MKRNLKSLLCQIGIECSSIPEDLFVKDICEDSRKIKKGDLFVGLPGGIVDGGLFWREAIKAGALAAVISSSAANLVPAKEDEVIVIVPDPVSYWIGELAAAFWHGPSSEMSLIGVTGTNGKTTITHLIEHLSTKCGIKTALFGTLYNRWPGYSEVATHTTSSSNIVHRNLAKALSEGVSLGVMEVSSHALDQKRVSGCHFSGAVFTNLTHDHLDYHSSMEAYYEAKAQLFKSPYLNNCEISSVINIDDSWGYKLSEDINKNCWRASLKLGWENCFAPELYFTDLKMTSAGVEGVLHSPIGHGSFRSPLIGNFNLMNMLQAVGILLLNGFDLEELLKAIATFPGVPGRMEKIQVDSTLPLVLVDYAHTPDGLRNALTTLRCFVNGNLICVFGCGGDRDKKKRPEMGSIATELADRTIITSDNPRNEDPKLILDDILAGITSKNDVMVEIDREAAIQKAIFEASANDLILIAGKGHEDYQILKSKTIKFDDRECARKALFSIKKLNPKI